MDIVQLIYEISLKILVIGGAIAVVILILLLCKVYFILLKISSVIEDIRQTYFISKSFFIKPFKFIKKIIR